MVQQLPPKPTRSGDWSLWGDAVDANVREFIVGMPKMQALTTTQDGRLSAAESGLASAVADLDTVRSTAEAAQTQADQAVTLSASAVSTARQAQDMVRGTSSVIPTTSTTTRPTTDPGVIVAWHTSVSVGPPTALMGPLDYWVPVNTDAAPPPPPAAGETFNLADGAAWPSPWVVTPSPAPAGAAATVQAGTGRLTSGKVGSWSGDDFIRVRYGTTQARDLNAVFTFTRVTDGANGRIIARSDADTLDPATGLSIGWTGNEINAASVAAWTYTSLGTAVKTHTVGVAYRMRVLMVGASVRVRTWPADGAEPTGWHIDATTTVVSPGYAGLASGSWSTAASQTLAFDDMTFNLT